MNHKYYKQGISLVETILAVAVIAFVIPALVVLGVVSLRSNTNASRRIEASKLASAAIEAVKYVRDSNGNNCGFSSLPVPNNPTGNPAYLKLNTPGGSICNVLDTVSEANRLVVVIPDSEDPDNAYRREIKLERYGSNSAKVTVTVSWGDESEGSSVSQSAIINSLTAF